MATKKELRLAYKQAATPAGVCAVRNRADGRLFLERTANIPGLMNRNAFTLKMGAHHAAALQADWDRLGAEAFELVVLEELDREALGTGDLDTALKAMEARWLADLRPWGERGYHRAPD